MSGAAHVLLLVGMSALLADDHPGLSGLLLVFAVVHVIVDVVHVVT